MVPLVFKTSVGPRRSWVGSIPIRLRHFWTGNLSFEIPDLWWIAMEKARAILASLLVVLGAGLLAFGFLHNSIPVSSKPVAEPVLPALDGEPTPPTLPVAAQTALASEPAVTQEVARGGVTRDAVSGRIEKTYEGTVAPKACPT